MDCQGPKTNSLRKIACGRIYKQNVQSEGQNRVEHYSKTTPNWYQICGRIYKRNVKSEAQNRVENYPKTTPNWNQMCGNPRNDWSGPGRIFGTTLFGAFLDIRMIFGAPRGDPENQGPPENGPKNLIPHHFALPGRGLSGRKCPRGPHGKGSVEKFNFL